MRLTAGGSRPRRSEVLFFERDERRGGAGRRLRLQPKGGNVPGDVCRARPKKCSADGAGGDKTNAPKNLNFHKYASLATYIPTSRS